MKKQKSSQNNNNFFWYCYGIESKIRKFCREQINLLSIAVANRVILIVALVIATVPSVVEAEEKIVFPIDHNIIDNQGDLSAQSLDVHPLLSSAQKLELINSFDRSEVVIYDSLQENEEVSNEKIEDQRLTLPSSFIKPQKIIKTTVTFYSSDYWQTDDTPFITANGTYVRDGIAAANFLPFGTKIMLPEIYGNKQFIVEDRMNQRYNDRVDIWVATYEEALQQGIKYNTILEIY